MPTLHYLLQRAGFDFEKGTVYMPPPPVNEENSPGWTSNKSPAIRVDSNDLQLKLTFNNGPGAPAMPRFVAYNGCWVYFPVINLDGSVGVGRVAVTPFPYLDEKDFVPTPYFGGRA